jgi:hypothetical protein
VAAEEGEEDVGDAVDGVEEVEVELEGGGLAGGVVVVEQEVLLDLGVQGGGGVWVWGGGREGGREGGVRGMDKRGRREGRPLTIDVVAPCRRRKWAAKQMHVCLCVRSM